MKSLLTCIIEVKVLAFLSSVSNVSKSLEVIQFIFRKKFVFKKLNRNLTLILKNIFKKVFFIKILMIIQHKTFIRYFYNAKNVVYKIKK